MAERASWEYVEADRCVCQTRCDLLYAYLVPSAAAAEVTLRNGENDQAPVITVLEHAAQTSHPFSPKEPVFCDGGLFIDVGANVTGVFVQWRQLS